MWASAAFGHAMSCFCLINSYSNIKVVIQQSLLLKNRMFALVEFLFSSFDKSNSFEDVTPGSKTFLWDFLFLFHSPSN